MKNFRAAFAAGLTFAVVFLGTVAHAKEDNKLAFTGLGVRLTPPVQHVTERSVYSKPEGSSSKPGFMRNLFNWVQDRVESWLENDGDAKSLQLNPHYVRQLTSFIQAQNHGLSATEAEHYATAVLAYSHQFNVDFRLTAAVIAVESSYRRDAVSPTGAQGLGQLKPATAEWLGVSNAFDPAQNIAGTARYLSFLTSHFSGDLDKAIAGYYQGQGAVGREGISEAGKHYLGKVSTKLNQMAI